MSEIRYFTDGEQATAAVLNRPLQDLSIKDAIMPLASFKANMKINSAKYPASGFINFGVHYSNNVNNKVNDGLWFYKSVDSWENSIILGDKHGNDAGYGDSLSRQPLVNAGGIILNLESINEKVGYDRNLIEFPPAPDGLDRPDFTRSTVYEEGNVISRKDISGLEVWAENINKTDMVYPYGNVQYRGGDNWGYGMIEGTFIGKEFYSLFGDWQEAGSLVGKGYRWSDLSDNQKNDFASNSYNNIYSDKEEYYQIRYRVRTIKSNSNNIGGWGIQKFGYGANAINPNNSSTYGYLRLLGQRHINKTERLTDWSMDAGTDSGTVAYTFDQTAHTKENGCYSINNSTVGTSNIPSMFLPLVEVQRYNSGIYHPFYNPFGTGSKNFKKQWNTSENFLAFDEVWNWGYYNNVSLTTEPSDGLGINKMVIRNVSLDGEHCALYGYSSGGFGELSKGSYKISFRYKMTDGTSPLTWSIRTNNFNNICYNNDSIKINGEFANTDTWNEAVIDFDVTDDFVNKNVHFWIVGSNGTGSGHGDTITKYHIELFKIEEVNNSSIIIDDTIDCFSNNVNNYIATSNINNPLSIKADEICEYNINDMRVDAKPLNDYNELLEREINKDFKGTTLGKEENTWGFVKKVKCYLNATNSTHSSMYTGPSGTGSMINWTVDYPISQFDGVIAIQRATNKMAWGSVSTSDHMRFFPWEEYMGSKKNTMIGSVGFTTTDIIEIYLFKMIKHSNIKNKEIIEIYGNMDNLPNKWKADMASGKNTFVAKPSLYQYFNNTLIDREGVLANPYDNEVQGTDFITFSTSRKSLYINSIYVLTKDGTSWKEYSYNGGGGDHTAFGYNTTTGGSANRIGINIDSSWIELGFDNKDDMVNNCLFMITYKAPTRFRTVFGPASQDSSLIKSNYVYASSTYYPNYGNMLACDLINKVSTSSDAQIDSNWNSNNSRAVVLRYNTNNSSSTNNNGSVFRKLEHEDLNLDCTNNNRFAFKVLPYLFELHNQVFIGYSFAEMINDEEVLATTGTISVNYSEVETVFKGSGNLGDKYAPELISTNSTNKIFTGGLDNQKSIIRISLSGMNATEQIKINGEVVYSGLLQTDTQRISNQTVDIPYNGQWIDSISVVGPGGATGTVTKIEVIKGQDFGDDSRLRLDEDLFITTDINGNNVTIGNKFRPLNLFVKKSYHSFKSV